MAKTDRKIIDKVFVLLGVAATLVLLAIGIISWTAYRFADTTVKTELTDQRIYFPPTNSPAFSALPIADQAALRPYAGQQLVNGAQAKVFSDNFIAYHLSKVAGGKTYSQVSAAAIADPTNTQLKQQAQTLFQGETLRGMLLGDGYAYWVFGQIALYAAVAALAGAAVMAILAVLGARHMARVK